MRLDNVGDGERDGVEKKNIAVLRCRGGRARCGGSAGRGEWGRVGEVAVFRRGREGANRYMIKDRVSLMR